MARAKAVILTQSATNPQPGYDPTPLVVVGAMPAGALPAPGASTAGGVAAGTAALLNTGTDTVLRGWSAKMIADYVAQEIAAIP